jgi:hypothetical protein
MKRHISEDDLNQRAYYRREFCHRNPERKKQLIEEEESLKRLIIGQGTDAFTELKERLEKVSDELLDYEFPATDISSIKVKSREFGDLWYYHNYKEIPIRPEHEHVATIHCVDPEDQTIIVKISLDREKGDIIKDINSLLDLLKKEGKTYGLNLMSTKRRKTKEADSVFEKYDTYLEVWDMVNERVRKRKPLRDIFRETAKEMFRKDFQEPDTLNEDDPDQKPESARKKVEHYYWKAYKLIREGGWRRI